MKKADYKDGAYVVLRKGVDATIYVTCGIQGFTVGIKEADVARANVQYTDVSLIETASAEQLERA